MRGGRHEAGAFAFAHDLDVSNSVVRRVWGLGAAAREVEVLLVPDVKVRAA